MTEVSILMPRGIRNNNPGNIRHGAARWSGLAEAQNDPCFATFTDPVMGLRALMRLLLTYYRKFGLDSVESILNRFAPPHENATDHYITAVAGALRIARRATVNLEDRATLISLARAITLHENGRAAEDRPDWYTDDIYEQAATLALGKEKP